MIAHVSLPAADCALVARVLAQIMGGGALRFPPGGPDAWNCWSSRNDFQIVVTPRGKFMVEGPHEQVWVKRELPQDQERAYESHFAISVERSAAEIVEIAPRAGMPESATAAACSSWWRSGSRTLTWSRFSIRISWPTTHEP